MAQDRALPHHIHRPQQRHRAAVHAQAQVLEVSDNQSDADHRHVLVRGLLRTAHHRQPALLGPLRRPVHEHRKASFTDLEMYWNVILGFFMSGANTGIKLMYQSIRDEQQMEELKQQNMQAKWII